MDKTQISFTPVDKVLQLSTARNHNIGSAREEIEPLLIKSTDGQTCGAVISGAQDMDRKYE